MPTWQRLADPNDDWNSAWFTDSLSMFVCSDGTIWLFDVWDKPSRMVRYTPTTNTWEQLPAVVWPVSSADSGFDSGDFSVQQWLGAGEYNGTVYLLGVGRDYSSGPSWHWAYIAYTYNSITGVITEVERVATAIVSESNPTTTITYILPGAQQSTVCGNVLWGAIVQSTAVDPASPDLNRTPDYGTFLVAFDLATGSFPTGLRSVRLANEQFTNFGLTNDGTNIYLAGGFFFPWKGGQSSDPSEPNDSIDWMRQITPSGTITTIAHDPNGHINSPSAAVFDGSLWLMTGWLEGSSNPTLSVRSLNLSTLVWTTHEDFPEFEFSGSAVVVGNKLYAGLGWNQSTSFDGGLYVLISEVPNLAGALQQVYASFDS